MFAERQRWVLRTAVVTLIIAGPCVPSHASAQGDQHSPFLVDLANEIVFDPTTYAPSIVAYDAAMRDWNTSQLFFRNGFLEHNPRFTVSGLPNDTPVSYSTGRRMILKDGLVHLGLSTVHNVTSRTLEHMLLDRHPEKRTLIRVIGWVERSVYALSLAYALSHKHYRQAAENERLALEYGFR
jgi:hypothetical protein